MALEEDTGEAQPWPQICQREKPAKLHSAVVEMTDAFTLICLSKQIYDEKYENQTKKTTREASQKTTPVQGETQKISRGSRKRICHHRGDSSMWVPVLETFQGDRDRGERQ